MRYPVRWRKMASKSVEKSWQILANRGKSWQKGGKTWQKIGVLAARFY